MKKFSVYLFAVIILEIFAIINAYIIDLKGASVDATRFLEQAIIWSDSGSFRMVVDAEFYVQFLGIFVRYITADEFFLAQLSIFFVILSVRYVDKIFNLLGLKNYRLYLLLLLLWPSMLTRVTTTMREPILMAVICSVTYYYLKYSNNRDIKYLLKATVILVIGALFHKAYAVAMVIFLIIPIIFFRSDSYWFKSKLFLYKFVMLGGLFFGIVYVLVNLSDVRGLQPLIASLTGDQDYMQKIVDSKASRNFRTTYDAGLDFSSPFAIVISLPKTILYYIYKPFIWDIRAPIDIYAFFESQVRLLGIICFGVVYKKCKPMRKELLLLLMIHGVITFIWAAGTSNYGTASRHHLTTNWFYIIYLVLFLRLGVFRWRKLKE